MKVTLVPAVPITDSGVSVLASRWASALATQRVRAQVIELDTLRSRDLESVVAADKGAAVLLGLPREATRAQRLIDAVSAAPARRAILWDRAGHTPEDSADDLTGLDRVANAWILNALHLETTQRMLPRARLEVLPLGIPHLFIREGGEVPTPSYAAYVGRFSVTKGALRLAQTWVSTVFPQTNLPLVMAGRGLSEGKEEDSVLELERDSAGALATTRLMSDADRQRFYSGATLVVFPATDDYLPQALAEAMGSGALIAATRIVGHAPLAYPGRTSLGLDMSLGNLLELVTAAIARDPATRAIAFNGRELIKRRHSAHVTGQALKRAFTRLHASQLD